MSKGRTIANRLKPERGWWRSDTGSTIADAAEDMLAAGMDGKTIESVLGSVIDAMRGEYGE